MCALVDANVASEVFGPKRNEASDKFFNWLSTGTGILVVGGQLQEEISKTQYRDWGRQALLSGRIRQALLSGRIKREDPHKVEAQTSKLKNEKACKSNDQHIIALAQLSGARLLFSNDSDLQQDFKNKKLIDNPRGRVYSTKKIKDYTNSHKRLLGMKRLCILTKV